MNINEVAEEIDAVVKRLHYRLANPPRQSSGRDLFDSAREDINRIRKTFQRKINTTWHPVNSREGIERKLADVVEAGLNRVNSLADDHFSENTE